MRLIETAEEAWRQRDWRYLGTHFRLLAGPSKSATRNFQIAAIASTTSTTGNLDRSLSS
jgi:hypothetical protein